MPTDHTILAITISEAPLLDKLSLYHTEVKNKYQILALACFIISYLQQLGLLIKTAYLDLGNHDKGIAAIFHIFSKLFTISEFLNYESVDISIQAWRNKSIVSRQNS